MIFPAIYQELLTGVKVWSIVKCRMKLFNGRGQTEIIKPTLESESNKDYYVYLSYFDCWN